MFGLEPSEAAKYAKEIFENQKVKTFFSRKKIDILELGAGLGRDTTYFAAESNLIQVTALDYSSEAITKINQKKKDYYSDPTMSDGRSAADKITTKVWDVRNKLPYKDKSFDGCFSHMLYCMALTTSEIIKLNKERAVDVVITRLRQKIEPDPKKPIYLQTVRGNGYVLWAD